MNMRKQVTIGIRMDSEFIALLRASVELGNLRNKDELTPIQQIALLAYAEARGAYEEEVNALILPAWRPHIEAVSVLRAVKEIA